MLVAEEQTDALSGGRKGGSALRHTLSLVQTADELDCRGPGLVEVRHQLPAERQIHLRRDAVSRQCAKRGRQHTEHRIRTAVEA